MSESIASSPTAPGHGSLSRSEHICKQIIAAILRGELGENRKLPTEVELAQRYQASRTTVREALSRLRSEGIVVSRRGSGNYVQRLPSLQNNTPAQIASIHDMERYYAFRECVEAGAAGIAATARQQEDLALMRNCLQALRRAQLEGQTGVEEDLALHLAIARATRNPFFISTIEHALGPIRQCMELAQNLGSPQDAERIQVIDNEHLAIIQAIAEGSTERAQAAMRAHIGHARLRIFEGC
ncbi:GntR family transcription regulator protein [Herbaspirillum rubrisubalbicans M1]|uniref:FadR/GntR family transcriptional regulator n=1 Tax=Herbaspirillum rubrisubalbicans TaxID=80842 RepID=UPI00073A3EC5|nr:FadR/GntR family transcriptional regulator [Herbaspirillum rubrisubalbicans]ALU91689.1 GntR family transcription regulator protein [Herbaspirillum rubrisubalbicans M1]